MDAIYIHKNYCLHDVLLYDQNDVQDLTTIDHKFQRYGLIANIVDVDQSIQEF